MIGPARALIGSGNGCHGCPQVNPNANEMMDTTRTAMNAASAVTTVATRLKKRCRRAEVTTTWGTGMALTIFTGRQFTAASRHSDKLIDRCGKLPPHCCILAPAKAPRNELPSELRILMSSSQRSLPRACGRDGRRRCAYRALFEA
jgi:hypothetical protein